MVSELVVIIKDDERTLKTKNLVYDEYTIREDDPIIKTYVDQALAEFAGEATDIQVKISMNML